MHFLVLLSPALVGGVTLVGEVPRVPASDSSGPGAATPAWLMRRESHSQSELGDDPITMAFATGANVDMSVGTHMLDSSSLKAAVVAAEQKN